MSEECTHDCSTCGMDCPSKNSDNTQEQDSFLFAPNKLSNVKKVIGVVSGKGGVGKSLVTGMLAVASSRRDYKTAVLDADVTGPSIPKMFGIRGEKVIGSEDGMLPIQTHTGIRIISSNLLLENEETPIIWRGPVVAGIIKQFWSDVIWDDVDYMFVDMPPGTGDVPLTVFQSLPVDGIVIVTSPQELVSMIVAKAVNMAKMMNIPVLGLVENMSYFRCPDCGKEHELFGRSRIEEVAKAHGLEVLDRVPIDPQLANLCDRGTLETMEREYLTGTFDKIEKL
ncbi:MAG: Mrp/NBP35 family ATP-binding protein [Clostridia bacterium]|nr:Mrp/NBP35 family ATP-binding protein [Clostridia bacterium]